MTTKQTLQLRHQLSCSDISIQAAAYDASRHHVLAYDSSLLVPHSLRLFSLRREIKSVKLFDEINPAPVPLKTHVSEGSVPDNKKKSTSAKDANAVLVPIVHSLSLEYSPTTDVFICVYTAQSIPLSRARSKRRLSDQEERHAVYNVLFLEPATLKKLVSYPGPVTHQLRCVFFDDSSDCLVLVIHRKNNEASRSNSISSTGPLGIKTRQTKREFAASGEGSRELDDATHEAFGRTALTNGGPMYNHIDVLQISKRKFKTSRRAASSADENDEEVQRTMLCIEKTGPSLLHSETISLVCGSKRLTRLFGVGYVSVGNGSSAGVESFLVEWRESAEQRLELIRRVMIYDLVTALALSASSTWLFTGHDSGALRVWNVSISGDSKLRAASYNLGSPPLEPELSMWHSHPVSSLRLNVVTSSAAGGSENGEQQQPIETMVITSDRDSGAVKHWRFHAGFHPQSSWVESQDDSRSSSGFVARIDLVGSYDCDSQVSGKQNQRAAKKKLLLDSVLCTVPIFVNIDMGGFTENLLLVLREDVIHVLKVQTVMHVLHDTRSGDKISTFRVVEHPLAPKLVVLSGNQFSSIRVLTLDASYQRTAEASYLNQLIPPASQRSTSISTMECYQTDHERSFMLCGWTCGSVDIYSLDTKIRVGMLQDPHLNAHITAIGVIVLVGCQELRAAQQASVLSCAPTRSWGGLLKSSVPSDDHEDRDPANTAGDQSHRKLTVYVFAGTEHGQIFGWKVSSSFGDSAANESERLLLECKIRVDSAHSAHVVQLARLRQLQANAAERLVSLGADGMVKVWEVPSLSILGYINTATEAHMSMPSCMGIVDIESSGKHQHLAVGFEDGMLAVWKLDQRKITFAELKVASHHERRVTSISAGMGMQPAAQSGSNHVAEFLSCSLDMTAIVWCILEDRVDEKRYFDVGAPVVDICTVKNVAIAALANEICAFEVSVGAPSSQSELPQHSASEQLNGTGVVLSSRADEHPLYRDSLRPETPTTHSDGEGKSEHASATETAERLVNVLRVPTLLAQSEDTITIPSALTTSSKFTFKPAALGPGPDRHSETPVRNRRKKTGRQESTKMPGNELCAMLQKYIESHGTNDTMSADYLTHFLANERLTIIKRPDFAIRKYLQEQKMDPKTRLSVFDACEILLAIQSAPETRKGKADIFFQQSSDNQPRQKRMKAMVNRKAVVSFNILGEKSIRWEVSGNDQVQEVELKKPTKTRQDDEQSRDPTPAAKSPTSASIRVPTDQAMSPPKESSASPPGVEEVATVLHAVAVFEDDEDPPERQPSRRKRNRKLSVAESMKSTPVMGIPDLIHRLKLSHCFKQHWSRGFCWCSPCSDLRVIWSDESETESAKCSDCNKKLHSLTLKKQGYKPHFSLRMVLGVIVEVYTELMIPSHSLLFKSTSRNSKDSQSSSAPFSIHSTLYRVFTNRFGMQKVVEDKIKQFLLSATHYIREIDAIAVFGELLAMFAREGSSSDAHVPNEMVALCVSCYSWFFSRTMVINGELIIGSGHDPGHSSQDTSVESENGKRTHWQFVQLENALLCAQEMLMYPLVSPGYLRNILMYTGEYAQAYPTKPQSATGFKEYTDEASRGRGTAQWIEIHRFLRLLVGEWKQQHSEFRVAEQTLFVQPLSSETQSPSTDMRAEVIEKLRLILNCFIFYDHEREGVMVIEDFANILRKLRYLWPNENVTAEEAEAMTADEVSLTFENTILAARRRFADLEGDGLICYLDFWAMLYIVGVRTLTLLKFREIPSFCRDYKLEIAMDLHELLLCYMQRSSTMMLPRGFQLGKSSLDQRAATQHQRRVGGLHDGVFRMPKALSNSLSVQELMRTETRGDPKDLIYLDGSAPALSQSASVSSMDRFRPLTRDTKGQQRIGVAPVVVGVRHMGPREKPRAVLFVSAILNDTLSGDDIRGQRTSRMAHVLQVDGRLNKSTSLGVTPTGELTSGFSNTYIQFPFMSPLQSRLEIPSKHTSAANHIVGRIPPSSVDGKCDGDAFSWQSMILKEHEDEERANHAAHQCTVARHNSDELDLATHQSKHTVSSPVPHHNDHSNSRKSSRVVPPALEANTKPVIAPPKPSPSAAVATEPVKRKKSATIVVIPKIEKDSVKSKAPLINAASSKVAIEQHYPLPGSKPKLPTESVLFDTKAAPAIDELPPAKPSILEHIETMKSEIHNDDAIGKTQSFSPEQAIEIVDDPSRRSNEEAPSVVTREFDKTQLPTTDDTTATADEDEEAEVRGDGDHSSDDEAEDDNADDQEESDNDESQDGSNSSTPRETIEGVGVDLTLALQELVVVESPSVIPADVVKTPPAAEISILQPQIPTVNSEKPEPTSSAPTVVEAQAPEVILQSSSKSDDVPPHRQSLGIIEFVHELTPNEPELTKTSDPPVEAEDVPPSKGTGVVAHHSFRFSQQPAFRANAPVLNNPFRTGQWNPNDDSDSEEERRIASEDAGGDDEGEFEEEDDGERPEDMELQLTPEALEAYRAAFKPHLRRSGVNGMLRPSLRHFGLAAAAASHMSGTPYKRSQSRDGFPQRNTREMVAATRSSEDDRALYGEKDPSRLGEGIVLTAEAEAQMQQKWLTFFSNAETAMFSPLKQEIEGREEAQRLQEELQSQLMKKRHDQQLQDTLRLQQSRRESAVLKTFTSQESGTDKASLASSAAAADSANFRLRRMTRESCQEIQNELHFGVSAQGEFAKAHDAQYFFFEYDPNAHGAILTLRLYVHHGEAEVFMSTDTKVPCVSDFMWRSVEKCKELQEGDGQKLVLYSHDLAKVVASAKVDSARGGGNEDDGLVIPFFISVVAVEPNTAFALSIMASGQKMAPSRAIQMVDTLIEQFNELSKSFEGRRKSSSSIAASFEASSSVRKLQQPSRDKENCRGSDKSIVMQHSNELKDGSTAGHRTGGFLDRIESRRRQSALSSRDGEEGADELSNTVTYKVETEVSDNIDADVDGSDESEASGELGEDCRSFQHLLESIGEKRGFGAPRSKSFFLRGPANEQFEFVQDEEHNLVKAASKYSPERLPHSTMLTSAELAVRSGAQEAIDAMMGERRLSMGSSTLLKHHARRASMQKKVAKRLSPLRGGSTLNIGGHSTSTPSLTTLRVAKLAPKPVAYSLSALDRDAHHLHQSKSSGSLPLRKANLLQVHPLI